MKIISLNWSLSLFFAVAVVLTSLPLTTEAASSSSRPTCTLSILMDGETTKVDANDKVLARTGSTVTLAWTSRNATKATNKSGSTIEDTGTTTVVMKSKASYRYKFTNSRGSVTCGVSLYPVSGKATSRSTASSSRPVTLTGTTQGVSSLTLHLTSVGTTSTNITKKLSLKRDKWSYSIPTGLPDGLYAIELSTTKSGVRTVVATSSLAVGTVQPIAATTIVVVPVPLLTGGVVRAAGNPAVAYLQVINIGTATATVSGITLTQAGTAPVASVVGLTARTDSGSAQGSVGTMLATPFVGSSVTVPLGAVLAPKQMTLVTVKAVMAPSLVPYVGTTLTLMVSGVVTTARLQSALPLFGTVWTVGY